MPDTVSIKLNGKYISGRLPKGKADSSQAYTIPSGQQNLEVTYYFKGLAGEYLVRDMKIDYNFLPGRRYAVAGEGKWGTGSYQLINEGVRLWIWDATDDSLFHIRNPEKSWPADVTFSADSSKIAFCVGKNIYVHSSTDGSLITTLTGHTGNVTSVRFNPSGDKLFSTAEDKTVRTWNLDGNSVPSTMITSKQNPYYVYWSADSNLLAMMIGKQIEVYDTGTGQLLTTFTEHNQDLRDGRLAFSPDGNRILSLNNVAGFASYKTDIILWETRTGKRIAKTEVNYGVLGIAWHPSGNRIALARGGMGAMLPILIDNALQEQGNLQVVPEIINLFGFYCPWSPLLYFKPDGTELFCITDGISVSGTTSGNLLDVETGKRVYAFTSQAFSSSFYHAVYSSDGSRIALLSSDGIRVWNSNFSK
jgi:WD40 repeat protein